MPTWDAGPTQEDITEGCSETELVVCTPSCILIRIRLAIRRGVLHIVSKIESCETDPVVLRVLREDVNGRMNGCNSRFPAQPS